MDNLFLATIPLIVFVALLFAKRGTIFSSFVGIISVILVSHFSKTNYRLDIDTMLTQDLPVVLILTLSIALVVFAGQIMNSLLRQSKTITGIGNFVESLEIPRLRLASLIVLGAAPALESLTGFGVSLFFTVPIFMHLFDTKKALVLSLLSMNIMPWGTLALSTLVGSQIIEVPFSELSFETSLTSSLIFPMIGATIYFTCKEENLQKFHQLLYPISTGLLLSSFLVFYNLYTTPEVAGVFSGISIVVIGLILELSLFKGSLFSRSRHSNKKVFLLFLPYILLITFVILSRIEIINSFLQNALVIQNSNIKFSVFTSPGIFIYLTVLCLYIFSKNYRESHTFILDGIKRAFYPVIGIFMFIVFAQIQRSSGILDTLASKGSELSMKENLFFSPFVGMISGYITGSNVGGNILFMPLQGEIGAHFDEKLLFAAVQNSSAGHAVFMSIPIILLTFSIAQVNINNLPEQRNWLIRKILTYAPLIYLMLVVSFYIRLFL